MVESVRAGVTTISYRNIFPEQIDPSLSPTSNSSLSLVCTPLPRSSLRPTRLIFQHFISKGAGPGPTPLREIPNIVLYQCIRNKVNKFIFPTVSYDSHSPYRGRLVLAERRGTSVPSQTRHECATAQNDPCLGIETFQDGIQSKYDPSLAPTHTSSLSLSRTPLPLLSRKPPRLDSHEGFSTGVGPGPTPDRDVSPYIVSDQRIRNKDNTFILPAASYDSPSPHRGPLQAERRGVYVPSLTRHECAEEAQTDPCLGIETIHDKSILILHFS